MSIASLDHPYLAGLLGDPELAFCFKADWHIEAMLEFETALAAATAAENVIPAAASDSIAGAIAGIEIRFDLLRAGVERDGLVVPVLVEEIRRAVGEKYAKHVHFGATSQDVIDSVQALCMKRAIAIYNGRLDALISSLTELNKRDGAIEVMAHTRMQAAIPVPASRKILSWLDPIVRDQKRLKTLQNQLTIIHFGGPAGTLEKFGDKGQAVRKNLAKMLGLKDVERPRHSERDAIVEFASWCSLLTGSLGKMGQDIALAAQSEIGEIKLASGGGSSAMPHKVNPIRAEMLVTLARFNATLVSGMHHAMVHENERSGAAWTLEWMLLPQIAVAAGAALRISNELIGTISFQPRD